MTKFKGVCAAERVFMMLDKVVYVLGVDIKSICNIE